MIVEAHRRDSVILSMGGPVSLRRQVGDRKISTEIFTV